jgi:hypothetical protein
MLKPIVVTACLIFALMVAIKDGRVLHAAGLTGSCSSVAALADGEVIEACKPGKLEGKPDLSKRNCTSVASKDSIEYWRCPADLASDRSGG